MANQTITDYTPLTGANVATGDLFEIVDIDVSTNKKITAEQLRRAVGPILGTSQASTSGTEIDFTGIPAGVTRVTVNFVGVSTDGTSAVVVQIGDAGGIENTGYLGGYGRLLNGAAVVVVNSTASFVVETTPAATSILHGTLTLTLVNAAAFTWAASFAGGLSDSQTALFGGGSKSLSAELTQVRITTAGGTANFDAGTINITYE